MGRSVIVPEMVEGEFLFKRFGAVVADYERAADEDTRLELLDGVMIMHSPANVTHERLFWFLGSVLRAYAEARRLGVVLGSRTAMILEEERRFEPDLLFVKNANLARLGDVWLEGPADLVVEIISLATREYDLGEKRDAYAAGPSGARRGLLLSQSGAPEHRGHGLRGADVLRPEWNPFSYDTGQPRTIQTAYFPLADASEHLCL